MKKILVVGQTPPPYGGQALMIERTLKGDYGNNIELFHIRMNFSKDIDNIGRIELKKILHLLKITILIFMYRIKYKTDILYYFPAGPKIVPIIRDIFILGTTKFLFSKIIYHFRAAGISEYLQKKNYFFQLAVKLVYGKPDVSIRLSKYTPRDDKYFSSKKNYIIPNGIEDNYKVYFSEHKYVSPPKEIHLLYIGVLNRTKGIMELLNAVKILNLDNVYLNLIGKFENKDIEKEVYTFLDEKAVEIKEKIIIHGVLIGEKKFEVLNNSDIFVFPSYFESEGLPGAILEAMSFGKPIVATNWRGIPTLVKDNYNGFLVPIKDAMELNKKIFVLCNNKKMRKEFGKKSRELYLSNFTINKFYKNLQEVFKQI